jgi:hypothetical protein
LTGVNALLKMFYTTKEIIGNCPKMNRLINVFLSDVGAQQLAAA